MIRLFNVTKSYAGLAALADVSFEVGKGEFVFVAGPSGAGKSTLIKLLMGQERAEQGQILINRMNLGRLPSRKLPELRRQLGVVFQDYKLIPTRTVFQNVALRLEIQGAPADYLGKKARAVIKKVGLEGREQALPPQLSGGEQQRVAIARAMIGDPLIILADEPTGNLDQDLTRGIVDLFREINRTGTTIMMATHNRELLTGAGHRIIRLDKGRLVA